jgi:methylated-DNA-[protein]-cysteine S-methyltransferase
MNFDACMPAPFGMLGIRAGESAVTHIEFLPRNAPRLAPSNALARRACEQLAQYLEDPQFIFDLPLAIEGTPFRKRVWQVMCEIPAGRTLTYGEVAKKLATAPRAVGGACGNNPLPIVIPCHRIVASGGGLGGFMGTRDADPLSIKQWLLKHEGSRA